MSRLSTSHFQIDIAERIGEADCIKALNRNRKALEKEKCLSWVISVGWNAMAQSINEVRTDLIMGTEGLEGNGKEVVDVGSISFPCTRPPLQADVILR